MKTISKLFFGAMMLSVGFVGCKDKETDDDGANLSPAEKVAGTYLVKDTIFYIPPSNPNQSCSPNADQISSFGIVITKVDDNKVTVNGFKSSGEEIPASVTNTVLVITEELGQAFNITGSISGNTIKLSYDTGGGLCFFNGRATAIKQE